MKLIPLLLATLLVPCALADTVQRIYTAPDPAVSGALRGSVNLPVTHALAVDHERVHVYRADMTNGGRTFSFPHLPTGKYDVVLVTTNLCVYEGLTLGDATPPADLPATSLPHLKERVAKQDAFFNHCLIHRVGFDGDTALALVERTSDRDTLRQDGNHLNANLRRLEVIELARATDDWQVTTQRHLYREEQPKGHIDFLKHALVPELGGLRIIDSAKDLGAITLPSL